MKTVVIGMLSLGSVYTREVKRRKCFSYMPFFLRAILAFLIGSSACVWASSGWQIQSKTHLHVAVKCPGRLLLEYTVNSSSACRIMRSSFSSGRLGTGYRGWPQPHLRPTLYTMRSREHENLRPICCMFSRFAVNGIAFKRSELAPWKITRRKSLSAQKLRRSTVDKRSISGHFSFRMAYNYRRFSGEHSYEI